MLKIKHNELSKVVKQYYKSKVALFVYGAFGIGKSYSVKDTAKNIAKEKGKEFKEWNKLNTEEKEEIYNNPSKYFVLIDERLSEYDSSDIKGLPDFKNNNDTIEWKIPYWAKFLTKKDSDGILFFDEINLAPQLVIASAYKILYDRIVDNSKINDNWLIIGAGNRDNDRAFTHTLPAPVRDRGGEVELVSPSVDDWINWASKNKIDSRILGFVKFKPSNLHKVDFDDNQKFTTERGFERLSNLIKDIDDYELLNLVASSAIGEGVANEFVSFCKIKEKINLDEVIKNPKKLQEIEQIDTKFFLVSSLAERYSNKDNKEVNFNKVMEFSKELDNNNDVELVALLWKICVGYTEDFADKFLDSKYDDLINKYGKYIF